MASAPTAPRAATVPIDFVLQSGLHKLSEPQRKRAIYVTGISKNASVKNLSDFFSFCGDVERIVQHTDPTDIDKQVAVVVFDDAGAASTAVLLAGAVVVDQPIEIFPFIVDTQELEKRGIVLDSENAASAPVVSENTGSDAGADGGSDGSDGQSSSASRSSSNEGSSSSSSQQQQQQPQSRKNAVSVIASLAAAGYVKGEVLIAEMKKKAKELDASIHVADTANQAYTATSKKMHDIDTDIHLTERVSRIKNTITTSTTEGVRTLNDKYELKSKADAVKDKAKELTNRAYEYPAIKTSVDYLSTGWSSVVGAWNSLRSETASEISKQRGVQSMTSQSAAAASSSSSSAPAAASSSDADEDHGSASAAAPTGSSPNPSTVPTVGSSAPPVFDDSNVSSSSVHNEPSAPPEASQVLIDFDESQGKEPQQVLYPDA